MLCFWADHTFRKQTTFNGEDRTPVWASDDKSFYYLSEEKGSFNILKRDIDGNTSKQITTHTKHPVRFLSAASNGTLCYGYDGEIYTVKAVSYTHLEKYYYKMPYSNASDNIMQQNSFNPYFIKSELLNF